MSIDLCVYDKCNNRCLMCTNPESPWPAWDGSFDYSYDAIIDRIEKRKQDFSNSESVYITGGEPTLHPRFLDIIRYLTKEFVDLNIKLLTNARMFSYSDFTKEFLDINNNQEIELSLYGPNKKIHDEITRSEGSFDQTIKGLESLLKYKKENQQIGIRFVVTGLSYEYIEDFLELINNDYLKVDRVIIVFMEYEGHVEKNKISKINYQNVRNYLDNFDLNKYNLKEVRFYHFPLCVIPKFLWSNTWKTWPEHEVEFISQCANCKVKKYCVGIHKGYLDEVGEKEFKTVTQNIKILKSDNPYKPIYDVN